MSRRGTAKKLFQSLLENDYVTSYEHACSLIISKRYDDFWKVILCIHVEYIHIFLPNGPIYLFNEYTKFKTIQKKKMKLEKQHIKLEDVSDIVCNVTKIIASAYKQHLSIYVKKEYNEQIRVDKKIVPKIVKNQFFVLNKLLDQIVHFKIRNKFNKRINENLEIKVQKCIGTLYSIDCDSLRYFVHDIQLWTHSCSSYHSKIVNGIWSILLNQVKKLESQAQPNVKSLARFFHSKLLQTMEKQSLILLNALFYFIYVYNYKYQAPPILAEKSKNILKVKPMINILKKKKDNYNNNTQKNKILSKLNENVINDPFLYSKYRKMLGFNSKKKKSKKNKYVPTEEDKFVLNKLFEFDLRTYPHVPNKHKLINNLKEFRTVSLAAPIFQDYKSTFEPHFDIIKLNKK